MEKKVKDMISVILSQAKQLYPKCSFTECEYGWSCLRVLPYRL